MIDIFEDLNFLGFVKQVLEEKIQKQEALIDAEKIGFYDKKLNYELSKELHTYQKWLNDVNSYIINKTVFGGGKYTMKKEELIKCNQSLLEQNKIDFLNEDINNLVHELKLMEDEKEYLIKENYELERETNYLREEIQKLEYEIQLMKEEY